MAGAIPMGNYLLFGFNGVIVANSLSASSGLMVKSLIIHAGTTTSVIHQQVDLILLSPSSHVAAYYYSICKKLEEKTDVGKMAL